MASTNYYARHGRRPLAHSHHFAMIPADRDVDKANDRTSVHGAIRAFQTNAATHAGNRIHDQANGSHGPGNLGSAALEEIANDGTKGVHVHEERVMTANAVEFDELRIQAHGRESSGYVSLLL